MLGYSFERKSANDWIEMQDYCVSPRNAGLLEKLSNLVVISSVNCKSGRN